MNVRLLFRSLAIFSAALVSASAALAQLTATPATTEGPYYPFNSTQRLDTSWLVGADNDLTLVAGSNTRATGTQILLKGQLVNLSGTPIAGAVIELWQTDNNGIYYHSGNNTTGRDTNFQSYGESVTDATGAYSFRTIKPGLYTGRIRHLHFKIKLSGTTLVTSQLLLEEERSLFASDSVTSALGTSVNLLVIDPQPGTDANGESILVATRQLVVDAAATSSTAPVITASPLAMAIAVGETATFSVTATGSGLTYQWLKNGAAISGATSATFSLPAATLADAASYSVRVSSGTASTTSTAARLSVTSAVARTSTALVNLSVRSQLATASSVLTAGFVVEGSASKPLLVRGVGPQLSLFGVNSVVTDPRITVFDSRSEKAAENDNWEASLASVFASVGAFALSSGSKDAAVLATLPAGAGTAQVSGGAGVALIEVYDTATTAASRLVNLSARATVGTSDSVLVAGFAIEGSGGKRLLVRGVGPQLAAFGVSSALTDPRIEIFDAAGNKLAENDNWAASLGSTFTATGAFGLSAGSRDAAIVATLPGNASYTVVVSGVGSAIGEALVELYEIE